MGTHFHDISRTGIKTESTSKEPRHWNPYKSAEWHNSSRFNTDKDNETLCALSKNKKLHAYRGATDEKIQ